MFRFLASKRFSYMSVSLYFLVLLFCSHWIQPVPVVKFCVLFWVLEKHTVSVFLEFCVFTCYFCSPDKRLWLFFLLHKMLPLAFWNQWDSNIPLYDYAHILQMLSSKQKLWLGQWSFTSDLLDLALCQVRSWIFGLQLNEILSLMESERVFRCLLFSFSCI